ncbi:MAG: hypothetical protein Edafosvirus3_81 [Edafosvirus sp.]|uniref:Uncharacterized protein n=1 Tax=Edafosvirus sp. TaxID=2487765 RepID=A0A3G4ZWM3_9VIRU|nr:MAG: hypothetical protein Edafosvirus3_81 [Edafosvirus sp.]
MAFGHKTHHSLLQELPQTAISSFLHYEPDNISDAVKWHRNRLIDLENMRRTKVDNHKFTSVQDFEKYKKRQTGEKKPVHVQDGDRADIILTNFIAKEKKYIEEEEKNRLAVQKIKNVEEKKKQNYEFDKLVKKLLFEMKPYVIRCLKRNCKKGESVNMKHLAFTDGVVLVDFLTQVHIDHNDSLLAGTTFPGCKAFGIEGGHEKCTWTYGEFDCSCTNFSGFTWNTDNVNWMNLDEISIDSKVPVGFQEAVF